MRITTDNYEDLDYSHLIMSIDLEDLTKFLVSLSTEEWVPSCYWNKLDITQTIYRGKIWWGIYSYLVKNGHISIENPYWEGRSAYNHTNEYYSHTSYYNPLEGYIYQPILKRLGEEKHLVRVSHSTWTIKRGISPLRKLKKHKI